LIARAGPLFAESAYVLLRLGDERAALAVLDNGRARLMKIALHLKGENLPQDEQVRLGKIRAGIREAEQNLVATKMPIDRDAVLARLGELRSNLLALIERSDSAGAVKGGTITAAGWLAAGDGAVVIPVISKFGGKMMIVTGNAQQPKMTVVDMQKLTLEQLDEVLLGKAGNPEIGGWIGAYAINYLQDETEISAQFQDWTAAISDIGNPLWDLLGKPLDKELKRLGIQPGARLIWLPYGGLGILPIGLAKDPASGRFLSDTYEIVYAPSITTLTEVQSQTYDAPSLAVVVNPTGDLPGTEKEAEAVMAHFPQDSSVVLKGAQATPDAVISALKGRSHWHFASHGTFSWQDARQSALIMHDKTPLTVGQLSQTAGLGRPRLVVLSACETGLFDVSNSPDEFIGLPGAFMSLGASGVLGTLWPVNDSATALLIAKFYDLHIGQGLQPPTALHRAKIWLRQATNGDIFAFSKYLNAKGYLSTRHLRDIEQEMSPEGLESSHSRSITGWIRNIFSKDVERPYAHPYFWGGFIYTGL
ncbi:MAG: CHAT domain-containing protein, partial [Pseudomonadota bacterium]